ncbi:MAG: D-alanine--D-alanine ligase [Clostridia bacterium]|nr:D-alanine--D-alanine ligase [Clostridia bacterium]
MKKIRLCVIFGGVSTEHDISVLSATSVLKNLNRDKYDIMPVGITKDGAWYYAPNLDLENTAGWVDSEGAVPVTLSANRALTGLVSLEDACVFPIDCVFPVLHGFNGEDGTIQGLFEVASIPYVGCGVSASAMSMDKSITKVIVEKAGVPQADYLVINTLDMQDVDACVKKVEDKFTYPVFVKPASTGSSVGVNKARDRESLIFAFNDAIQYDSKFLVEEFIDGREIETAVMGNEDAIVSVCGEVLAEQEFYSFDAKYNDTSSKTQIPADLPEDLANEVRRLALIVYHSLGAAGLSRVDFFVCKDGRIVFNEINTLPGFTSISMYPKLFGAVGVSYSDLLDKIVDFAFSAYEIKKKYK